MYSINQHFKTSTSLIIQNIINIEPVYTGPRKIFSTDRSLHESAFCLHGTRETVQIFRRQINNIAICNKRCPVPYERFSPVRKFVRSKICTDQCKRGPIFASKLLSYSVLKQELFVDIKQAGKHRCHYKIYLSLVRSSTRNCFRKFEFIFFSKEQSLGVRNC